MTDRPRLYRMQGRGGEGRALRIDVVAALGGDRPPPSPAQTPIWLRHVRADRREFIV